MEREGNSIEMTRILEGGVTGQHGGGFDAFTGSWRWRTCLSWRELEL